MRPQSAPVVLGDGNDNLVKKSVVLLLKFAVPVAIIAWLLLRVPEDQFRLLQQRPKDWLDLTTAFLLVLSAVCLTFVRWYFLVRALNIPFRMLDAFRLGFLGYLLNFVSAGSVGGDLFKAFFLAREQPGMRAEAVATVVVDRMIGLYALLVLTSGVILATGIPDQSTEVTTVCRLTLVFTAVGAVGIIMVLIPGFTNGAVSEMLTNVPKAGPTIGRLITAVRIYRRRWRVIVLTMVMGLGTHTLFALALFLISNGMFEHAPTLREHLILVPLGMLAGAMPFTPAGFGAFEFAIDQLYRIVPAGANDVSGVLVALAYRLMTILVATVGVAVYWMGRNEMRQLLQQAETEADLL